MKITLRDLFWLTLVVAVLLGWGLYAMRVRSQLETALQRQADRDRDWAALRLSEAELVKARQRLAEPIDLTGFEELGTHDPEQLRARVKEVKAQIVLPPLEREIAIRKARLAIE